MPSITYNRALLGPDGQIQLLPPDEDSMSQMLPVILSYIGGEGGSGVSYNDTELRNRIGLAESSIGTLTSELSALDDEVGLLTNRVTTLEQNPGGGSGGSGGGDVAVDSLPARALSTPFLNTAMLRFQAESDPRAVPLGYMSGVDVRYFGVTPRDFNVTATDAQAQANLAALQTAADWCYTEGGLIVLPAGLIDIYGTVLMRPGFGIMGQGKHHSKIRQRQLARSASETYADVFAPLAATRCGYNTFIGLEIDGGWNMRDYEGAAGPNWTYDPATKNQKGISINTPAGTESAAGNGPQASAVREAGTDAHTIIRDVSIRNVAGIGLYQLGRGETQVNGLEISRSAKHGLFTSSADCFYHNVTSYLNGDCGMVVKSAAGNGRFTNSKFWFCGMQLSAEPTGAGVWLPDNGTTTIVMRAISTQDTWGPGFVISGNTGIDIDGECDEAGGGRLMQQGVGGYTGTRSHPRSFVRAMNTLVRARVNLAVKGGARLTAADYPYLVDLSGAGIVDCKFTFRGRLTDTATDASTYTMDMTSGTITASSGNRQKNRGVLWTNGLTNAKKYNEVWFGERLLYGWMTQANLDDTTHGVNDALYGPTRVLRDDGRTMVKSPAGTWVAQGT